MSRKLKNLMVSRNGKDIESMKTAIFCVALWGKTVHKFRIESFGKKGEKSSRLAHTPIMSAPTPDLL